MGGFLEGWPPEAIISLLTLGGAALWTPVVKLLEWKRGGQSQDLELHKQGWVMAAEREDEIVVLRGLIMRAVRRETGYATGCELLLVAMPETLTPEQLRLVNRAKELFEVALLSHSGDGGGGT